MWDFSIGFLQHGSALQPVGSGKLTSIFSQDNVICSDSNLSSTTSVAFGNTISPYKKYNYY